MNVHAENFMGCGDELAEIGGIVGTDGGGGRASDGAEKARILLWPRFMQLTFVVKLLFRTNGIVLLFARISDE